jgi:hypothetical protein
MNALMVPTTVVRMPHVLIQKGVSIAIVTLVLTELVLYVTIQMNAMMVPTTVVKTQNVQILMAASHAIVIRAISVLVRPAKI